MRPQRFVDWLHALIATDPQATNSRTLADVGYTRCPFGCVVRMPTGALVYLQVVATPFPGDDPSAPESPTHGDPPPVVAPVTLPTSGTTVTRDAETHLAHLVTAARCTEISSVGQYSRRPRAGAVPYGMTIRFHNGSKLYVYLAHCLPPGKLLYPRDKPFAGPLEF